MLNLFTWSYQWNNIYCVKPKLSWIKITLLLSRNVKCLKCFLQTSNTHNSFILLKLLICVRWFSPTDFIPFKTLPFHFPWTFMNKVLNKPRFNLFMHVKMSSVLSSHIKLGWSFPFLVMSLLKIYMNFAGNMKFLKSLPHL